MDAFVDGPDTPWRRAVDKIIRGERPRRDYLDVLATPDFLVGLGFSRGHLVITPGKLARCRRKHPAVTLAELYRLPDFLGDPAAVFPSQHDDGSQILLLVTDGSNGKPIIAAILPGEKVAPNVILSIYDKEAGMPWVWRQIEHARKRGIDIWMRRDFAATQPQPGIASDDPIPSPSGLIPASGATKPVREVLTLRSKVKDNASNDGSPS